MALLHMFFIKKNGIVQSTNFLNRIFTTIRIAIKEIRQSRGHVIVRYKRNPYARKEGLDIETGALYLSVVPDNHSPGLGILLKHMHDHALA